MNKRFGNQLNSEFRGINDNMGNVSLKETKNLYVKRYPNFFKREDVRGDFVAVQREIHTFMPSVKILKEDVDASMARIQFDVSPSEEVLLEKILLKRGFVKNTKTI